jgi:DNA primase
MVSAKERERMPDSDFRALVDSARDRHNLSDIVGRYTKLKDRGSGREKVGLCPFHNERSPSFEVNDDKGTYHCHGCGVGGDAYRFLMSREGMNFFQAYEALAGDEFPDVCPEERAKRKADDERITAARIAVARSIWDSSIAPEGTLAQVYLRARGIGGPIPASVRFGSVPRYFNLETGEVGREYPAVICALTDAAGSLNAVQCIYLERDGRSKYVPANGSRSKLTFGIMRGSAIRLADAGEHVVICEGPEDGLTLWSAMPELPVFVSCGTAALALIEIPPVVRKITLAGDNGAPGRKAVYAAKLRYMASGLEVDEIFPDREFKDFNDQLRGARCQ